MTAAVLVLAGALGAATPVSATPAVPQPRTAPASPPSFTATGYFHTAFADGRWWLVTPDGQPFYATAVDHVTPDPDTDQSTGLCPYCGTIAAEYPSTAAWATATVTRLHSYGFNSLGAFSDDGTMGSKMPYTVLLGMASGDDWFSPSFVTNADSVAATQVAPLADDPNLIGWYTDSELQWGPDWRGPGTLLADYLALPAGSPGLAVAQQYVGNPDGFLLAVATRYFQVTTAAIRMYDPNHLILGVKAIAQLIEPELLEAARPYVNVFSIDDYALTPFTMAILESNWPQYMPVEPNFANFEQILQLPIMVGEYSFRAATPNTPNTYPPIYPTFANQGLRAAAYASYASSLYYSAPSVVGDDWFEYVDEPAGGRTGDGEDSNFGVVNVFDQPYTPLANRMALVHATAPDRQLVTGTRCDSWADVGGVASCDDAVTPAQMGQLVPAAGAGYWLAGADGGVFAFGDAPFYGSMGGRTLHSPIVGIASTPDDLGYWLVAADGGVFAFGDAQFDGSMAAYPLAAPVVGMAAAPQGGGYWLVGADGSVYAMGDAQYFGSMAGTPLQAPVVGIAATADGGGYWLVAKDGGIFAFGDAQFYGSMGGSHLNAPITGIMATPDDQGYWLVAKDGGIFAFGDARFDGSMGGTTLPAAVVGVDATPTGYRMATTTGGVYDLGGALFQGAISVPTLAAPVVGVAS